MRIDYEGWRSGGRNNIIDADIVMFKQKKGNYGHVLPFAPKNPFYYSKPKNFTGNDKEFLTKRPLFFRSKTKDDKILIEFKSDFPTNIKPENNYLFRIEFSTEDLVAILGEDIKKVKLEDFFVNRVADQK